MNKNFAALTVLISVMATNLCYAQDISKDINSVISNSNIKKGAISVSIKSIDDKKTLYETNSNVPMPPASIQKLVTTLPAVKTLGENYQFETKLYKDKAGNYLIVLGADPYLKSSDLKQLTKKMPPEVKSINIDDSIIDKQEWGEGWHWDDDINPLMPKFSAYNIDRNTLKVFIEPTVKDAPANIIFEKDYPTSFINQVVTGNSTSYTIEKKSYETPDVVTVKGVINKTVTILIPVNSPKKYFKLRLTDALLDNEKSNSGVFYNKKLTKEYFLVDKVSHSIQLAKTDILKNSDNYVSETLFKLAGGKFKHSTGTFEAGKEMFENYCTQMKLDDSQVHIVDASGISKNNLMVSDFMTDFLIMNKVQLEPMMATSGEGTMADRLLYLKGNIKAKTGTLTNVSTITGYLATQNGHKYAFCIMINDAKSKNYDKKLLEDNLIKTIYLKG